MKITLLADYRGVLSGEEYYTAGIYSVPDDMPQGVADALVAAGRATADKPKPRPKPRKAKRKGL